MNQNGNSDSLVLDLTFRWADKYHIELEGDNQKGWNYKLTRTVQRGNPDNTVLESQCRGFERREEAWLWAYKQAENDVKPR